MCLLETVQADETEDVIFEGGFRVPAVIYNRLFDYQKTGTSPTSTSCLIFAGPRLCCPHLHTQLSARQHLYKLNHPDWVSRPRLCESTITLIDISLSPAGVKWMWELHTQRAGGIIGDEMGLGKTVRKPLIFSHEFTPYPAAPRDGALLQSLGCISPASQCRILQQGSRQTVIAGAASGLLGGAAPLRPLPSVPHRLPCHRTTPGTCGSSLYL